RCRRRASLATCSHQLQPRILTNRLADLGEGTTAGPPLSIMPSIAVARDVEYRRALTMSGHLDPGAAYVERTSCGLLKKTAGVIADRFMQTCGEGYCNAASI